MLSKKQFIALVKNAPLISIDLIIRNGKGHILLGKRKNNPAKGFYFVPGGRIFKNESLTSALSRLLSEELHLTVADFDDIRQFKVYEHFYKNENVYNIAGMDTHYIVIAHSLKLKNENILPTNVEDQQHSGYIWMPVNELMENKNVHDNTKLFFK